MNEDFKLLNPAQYFEASKKPPQLNVKHLKALFKDLAEHWKPLFIMFSLPQPSVEVEFLESSEINTTSLSASFFINSVEGRMEVDRSCTALLSQTLSDSQKDIEIIVSYLLRRVLFSVEKSWIGHNNLSLSYSDSKTVETDLLKHKLRLSLKFEGFDNFILDFIVSEQSLAFFEKELESISNVKLSIKLSRFYLSTEELIEKIRPGNIFKLEQPLNERCEIYFDSKFWANASIKTYNSQYILDLQNFIPKQIEIEKENTEFFVEFDSFHLPGELEGYSSVNTLVPTNISVDSNFYLSSGNERIAKISLGFNQEKDLMVKILEKI